MEHELKNQFPGDFGLGDYCEHCGGNHAGGCEESRRWEEDRAVRELQLRDFEQLQKKEKQEREKNPSGRRW